VAPVKRVHRPRLVIENDDLQRHTLVRSIKKDPEAGVGAAPPSTHETYARCQYGVSDRPVPTSRVVGIKERMEWHGEVRAASNFPCANNN